MHIAQERFALQICSNHCTAYGTAYGYRNQLFVYEYTPVIRHLLITHCQMQCSICSNKCWPISSPYSISSSSLTGRRRSTKVNNFHCMVYFFHEPCTHFPPDVPLDTLMFVLPNCFILSVHHLAKASIRNKCRHTKTSLWM